MDDQLKKRLKLHSDAALLWIDQKQKQLQWEHSPALQQQKVAAQSAYQEWKQEHKLTALMKIRDDLYTSFLHGWDNIKPERAIAHVGSPSSLIV